MVMRSPFRRNSVLVSNSSMMRVVQLAAQAQAVRMALEGPAVIRDGAFEAGAFPQQLGCPDTRTESARSCDTDRPAAARRNNEAAACRDAGCGPSRAALRSALQRELHRQHGRRHGPHDPSRDTNGMVDRPQACPSACLRRTWLLCAKSRRMRLQAARASFLEPITTSVPDRSNTF